MDAVDQAEHAPLLEAGPEQLAAQGVDQPGEVERVAEDGVAVEVEHKGLQRNVFAKNRSLGLIREGNQTQRSAHDILPDVISVNHSPRDYKL